MQHCCQAERQVRAPVLELDGLLEDRETVLVDILVSVMLVDLELECGQLRQHHGGQPRFGQDRQPSAGKLPQEQSHQLVADTFG